MKIVIFCAIFAVNHCYSPFHKQPIGQRYNAPVPCSNQWTVPGIDRPYNRSLQGGIGTNVFEVMFQWNIMEFAYPSQQLRAQAISSGQFIPENVAPLGIAVSEERVFVTTPRWNDGIPASLSIVQLPAFTQSPALEPVRSRKTLNGSIDSNILNCSILTGVHMHQPQVRWIALDFCRSTVWRSTSVGGCLQSIRAS